MRKHGLKNPRREWARKPYLLPNLVSEVLPTLVGDFNKKCRMTYIDIHQREGKMPSHLKAQNESENQRFKSIQKVSQKRGKSAYSESKKSPYETLVRISLSQSGAVLNLRFINYFNSLILNNITNVNNVRLLKLLKCFKSLHLSQTETFLRHPYLAILGVQDA